MNGNKPLQKLEKTAHQEHEAEDNHGDANHQPDDRQADYHSSDHEHQPQDSAYQASCDGDDPYDKTPYYPKWP